ncbi:MAG: hypothetical protein LUQ69_10695 [Methanoregulaceae archaeon]|jgi:hypothetical protein|nr:hypothetical protein [Methanoregulaceae archaeon]
MAKAKVGIESLLGKNVVIRTSAMADDTYVYTGFVVFVGLEIGLSYCSWVNDTGPWTDFLNTGIPQKCQPYLDDQIVYIPRSVILDMTEWLLVLPRDQK